MEFFINKNRQESAGNNNEIHKETCRYLPKPENRIYLGDFSNSYEALIAARKYYPYTADGCIHCCPEIHTK